MADCAWRAFIRQLFGHARRNQELPKEPGQQFGVTYGNQVAERRGIRDGQHPRSAMQSVQQVRLGLQFFRRVVVEIDVAGQEIFGLDPGKPQ